MFRPKRDTNAGGRTERVDEGGGGRHEEAGQERRDKVPVRAHFNQGPRLLV